MEIKMLDGVARKAIDPALDRIGRALAGQGISANAITITGFGIGLGAALAISVNYFWLGVALILISRLCDGLDGTVARHHGATDFGGYLDIVLDFAFYGIIPLAFAIVNPSANALAAATLILSFYVNGASFLAFAILAEKRKLSEQPRGQKSIFFTIGLAEATETLGVFIAACFLPAWFPVLAYAFAIICFYTAFVRIVHARAAFN
jgi:phosphatidylglycerophosphate synthase